MMQENLRCFAKGTVNKQVSCLLVCNVPWSIKKCPYLQIEDNVGSKFKHKLTIMKTNSADDGLIKVLVKNKFGEKNHQAKMGCLKPAKIVQPAMDSGGALGSSATFHVVVDGKKSMPLIFTDVMQLLKKNNCKIFFCLMKHQNFCIRNVIVYISQQNLKGQSTFLLNLMLFTFWQWMLYFGRVSFWWGMM